MTINGDSFNQTNFTTVQACKEDCATTKGCTVFVANFANQTCFLKGGYRGVEETANNVTSGRMSCYKGHYCLKKGVYLYGGDIKSMPFTTVEACKDECAKTTGCVAFQTEAGTENKCYLKNKDHDPETALSRAISARMSCYEDHYCWKKGFTMIGGSFKNISFTTIKACKEECAKTAGCVAFVTVTATWNTCFLKDNTHAAESAGPTAISVRMSCYEDHYCWKKGVTMNGGDFKNIAFTTIKACKEECAKTAGCVAFVTVTATWNTCFLKNNTHAAESAGPTAISVRMSCYEDHYCWKKGVYLHGGDIKSMPFTTVEACKDECARTEGCVAFATNASPRNRCDLKNKDHAAESAGQREISVRMSCYKDHYCWKKGFYLYGGDIKSMPFTTVEACKDECAKTTGCVAFQTEAGTENKCYLKNKDHDPETALSRAISARMSCYEDHYCWKKGFYLHGGDIKSISFTTVEACEEECTNTEGCVAIATNSNRNRCDLKNKNHNAESADPKAISVRMSCYKDDYCLKRGIDLNSGNIKNVHFTTLEACKEECAKTVGCVGFATKAGIWNRCYAKSKSHGAERAGGLFISALMNCYEGNLFRCNTISKHIPI